MKYYKHISKIKKIRGFFFGEQRGPKPKKKEKIIKSR